MVKIIKDTKATIISKIKSNLASGQTNIAAFEINLEIINDTFKTSLESILTFCENLNEIHKDNLITRNKQLLKEVNSLLESININKTGLKKELLAKNTYSAQKRQTYKKYIYMENELCKIGLDSSIRIIDTANF